MNVSLNVSKNSALCQTGGYMEFSTNAPMKGVLIYSHYWQRV